MRKPDAGGALDQFQALSISLKQEGKHDYAAFCSVAAARCENNTEGMGGGVLLRLHRDPHAAVECRTEK